ncbi:MAG: hypothetical protein KDK91_06545 [Gammaproteobacteria bacterium]|nr:hypothetical protein [Gammaproteobacteria bacterium]
MSEALLKTMDEQILDGRHHQATDTFCQLATGGHDLRELVLHVMRTAAPYLHVPAHEKLLPNGEFRNVNYDHTVLGLRAGLRLAEFLPRDQQHLPLVQGVYYVPQGLDVWAQLECGFPGHYAREQERCAEDALGHELHRHFEDQPPLVEGSVDERFERMFHALTSGDKSLSYRLFLGLAAQPELRKRLQDQLLFAAIIDQQEYNSFRRVRHIGHKAIRARSMFDLADWVGWERAHPFFYVVVPDICNAPIFHSLYDHASFLLGTTFRGGQYDLHERNSEPLGEDEQDRLIGLILEGDPVAVSTAITGFLGAGKALRAIADVIMIAHATHCVQRLRAPIAYTVPTHSFDYANVVNHWLRNFSNPHQAKAVYLSAWFVTDTIGEVDSYPDLPDVERPDPDSRMSWAERFSTDEILVRLAEAVREQDPSSAVALVRSYTGRSSERDRLISTLVACAGRFQGDAHIFRNARSVIEEYRYSSVSQRRKNVLFEYWAHFLSFYKKRTLDTDCYDMYQRYFAA